ncbi:MAG: 4Fe-4S dicluster domain-containing protein, partial [Nitriliruptorales bacterium]
MSDTGAVTRTLDAVLPDATHGSYCPKMCAYSCPVLAATGREETNPWGLHRSVVAVGAGNRDEAAYRSLHGCTGCHACQRACLYDLDVPGEVRAARTAVVADGGEPEAVRRLVHDVREGVSAYGTSPSERRSSAPDMRVVLGCADGPE